jgi:hypothetical protein
MTETTFNLDSPATSNNQYFILVRFYYGNFQQIVVRIAVNLILTTNNITD